MPFFPLCSPGGGTIIGGLPYLVIVKNSSILFLIHIPDADRITIKISRLAQVQPSLQILAKSHCNFFLCNPANKQTDK